MLRTVTLHSSEDVMSFLSRLAAANGVPSMKSMIRQLGATYDGMVTGKVDQVERVSRQLGPYHPADIADASYQRPAASFPGKIRGHSLRGVFTGRSVRYCAACLIEDLRHGTEEENLRPYRRLSWLIPDVVSCHKHEVALSEPQRRPPKGEENEFHHFIRLNMESVARQARDSLPCRLTPYERYRARRFDGLLSEDLWLDQMPVDVIHVLSQHLGTFILHAPNRGPGQHETSALRHAREKGYDLLRSGEIAVKDAIRSRANKLWKRDAESEFSNMALPSSLFGSLFRILDRDSEGRYRHLTPLVREVGLELLPLGPNDKFLGPVTERRYHTATSLGRQFGLHVQRVYVILREHGLPPPGVPISRIPIGELPLDVLRKDGARIAFDRFLHQYSLENFVGTIVFDKAWPHSIREVGSPSVKYKAYTSADAETLLALLTAKASPPSKDPRERMRDRTIHQAAKIVGVHVNSIIELLAAGELNEVVFYGGNRFSGICVCTEELKTHLSVT